MTNHLDSFPGGCKAQSQRGLVFDFPARKPHPEGCDLEHKITTLAQSYNEFALTAKPHT
jgi:hypothetical protein